MYIFIWIVITHAVKLPEYICSDNNTVFRNNNSLVAVIWRDQFYSIFLAPNLKDKETWTALFRVSIGIVACTLTNETVNGVNSSDDINGEVLAQVNGTVVCSCWAVFESVRPYSQSSCVLAHNLGRVSPIPIYSWSSDVLITRTITIKDEKSASRTKLRWTAFNCHVLFAHCKHLLEPLEFVRRCLPWWISGHCNPNYSRIFLLIVLKLPVVLRPNKFEVVDLANQSSINWSDFQLVAIRWIKIDGKENASIFTCVPVEVFELNNNVSGWTSCFLIWSSIAS